MLNIDTDHFANLAVDAVLRIKGTGNLESINILKKVWGPRLSSHFGVSDSNFAAEGYSFVPPGSRGDVIRQCRCGVGIGPATVGNDAQRDTKSSE